VAVYAASLPALLRVLADPGERAGIVAVLGAALSALLGLPLMDCLPARLLRLPLIGALAELSRESRRLVTRPRRCAAVLGLSVIAVGLSVLASMLIGDSLGVRLSFVTWLLVVPPVGLIQLLPVSLAGWGVREAGMVVILAGFGVPAEAALAISVLTGLGLVAIGLPGGLIWLADWDIARPRPGAADGLARSEFVE
jgi:glycosyltransferase 2 family protein